MPHDPGVTSVRRSVCVIVPSYRSRENLVRLLPDLLRETRRLGAAVLVCDDASDDGTADAVARAFPEVGVIRRERNGGFGDTCNSGVRAAEGHDIVVLLNTDVRVLPGFLEPLLAHFDEPDTFAVSSVAVDPETGRVLVGPRLGTFRRGRLKWRRLDLAPVGPADAVWPSLYAVAAHAAFDRRKFLELGGFDPLFRPYYWEDVDLGYRALKRGWRVLVDARSRVHHLREHSDIERTRSRAGATRVRYRNRYLFLWKNLHEPGLFWGRHVLPTALRLLYAVVLLEGGFYATLARAGRRLPEALRARRHARAQARRGDGEVLREVRDGLATLQRPRTRAAR